MFTNLKQVLPFDEKDFNRLVYPLLENYASFVQLLPASQNHHHKAMGGLLHHGMDVAYKATQAARKVYFHEKDPQVRRENKPRWRLACFIAGLLHDIGKPYTDIHVHDESGKTTWDPEIESLYAWAQRNKINKYFLDWRPGRHGQHLRYSAAGLERFLPEETRMYIRQFSPVVFEQLRAAVSEVSMDNNISRAVARADQESVRHDLERMGDDPTHYLTGIPIQRYAVSAIRRLLGSGKWTANQPGSKVFVLEEGVFVNWVAGFKDVLELLESENVKGFPKEAFTIADKLVEARTAEPNFINSDSDEEEIDLDDEPNDSYYVYWFIAVQFESEGVSNKKLDIKGTLKFKAGTIFPFEPPAPMVGNIIKKDTPPESKGDKSPSQELKENPSSDTTSASSDQKEDQNRKDSKPASNSGPGQKDAENAVSALQNTVGEIEVELPLEAFGFDINAGATDSVSDEKEVKVGTSSTEAPVSAKTKVTRKKANVKKGEKVVNNPENKSDQQAKTAAAKPENTETASDPTSDEKGTDIASTLLKVTKKGEAFDLLLSMLEDVFTGKRAMGECLYQHGSKIALLYPEGAQTYGYPADVMKIFRNEEFIDHEPGMNMMFVRDIGSYKALVFTNKIGNTIQKLIQAAEDELEAASSKKTLSISEDKPTENPEKNREKRALHSTRNKKQHRLRKCRR